MLITIFMTIIPIAEASVVTLMGKVNDVIINPIIKINLIMANKPVASPDLRNSCFARKASFTNRPIIKNQLPRDTSLIN